MNLSKPTVINSLKKWSGEAGDFSKFKEGTVYPALRKLENEGLIKGEWRRVLNRQERRYYQITARGKEALAKKMALWQSFSDAVELIFKPARSWRGPLMLAEVRSYLDSVRAHLHLDTATEKHVIRELYTYFQERIAEQQEQGVSEKDATREAIKSF